MDYNNRGFSVLEALAALSLLGIIMAISMPSFSRVPSGAEVKDLTHALNLVRLAAAIEQKTMKVAFPIGSPKIFVSSVGGAEPETIELPRGFTVTQARFGNLQGDKTSLLFYATRTATPGSVTIAHRHGTRCVITQPLRSETRSSCTQ